MSRVLIVANQTIGGGELEAAVSERAAGACQFHLLVPEPAVPAAAVAVGLAAVESAATALMELPDQHQIAEERLAAGLAWLAGLGIVATGEVCTGDTVEAVAAIVPELEIDEIVVSTLPSRISRWLKQDLPCKIGKAVSVPVSVITAN